MRVAVVVAWNGRHQDWLTQALVSIDTQLPTATQRCLVIDSADGNSLRASLSADGWLIRVGDWKDPAAARNEGMQATGAPWLVFWDADNVVLTSDRRDSRAPGGFGDFVSTLAASDDGRDESDTA